MSRGITRVSIRIRISGLRTTSVCPPTGESRIDPANPRIAAAEVAVANAIGTIGMIDTTITVVAVAIAMSEDKNIAMIRTVQEETA